MAANIGVARAQYKESWEQINTFAYSLKRKKLVPQGPGRPVRVEKACGGDVFLSHVSSTGWGASTGGKKGEPEMRFLGWFGDNLQKAKDAVANALAEMDPFKPERVPDAALMLYGRTTKEK